jgi:hypothetical protein
VDGFREIVESRIREAIERGDLDDLPGAGRRLELDDDAMVPPEMRAAYRILKNAGYLPEELALRREIADVEALLEELDGAAERRRARKRLGLLRTRLAARGGPRSLHVEGEYGRRILRRLSGKP